MTPNKNIFYVEPNLTPAKMQKDASTILSFSLNKTFRPS